MTVTPAEADTADTKTLDVVAKDADTICMLVDSKPCKLVETFGAITKERGKVHVTLAGVLAVGTRMVKTVVISSVPSGRAR